MRSLSQASRPKLVLREVGSPSFAQRCDPYLQNRIAYRLLRRAYAYADRIITLTEGARRDLAQNFAVPDELISVMLTNAVVPPAMVDRIARWDGEAGRERDLIVCVGRLSPEKDQRTLIRAVSILPPAQAWRLAIVGDGPERPALEALARELGVADRIVFAGEVTDPFAFMMRARLAVCASVYEGLGNAIIEALACGTPVVSTDCPYGPCRNPARRPLRRVDAGRRRRRHGGGDRGGVKRHSRSGRAAGARAALHGRARRRALP